MRSQFGLPSTAGNSRQKIRRRAPVAYEAYGHEEPSAPPRGMPIDDLLKRIVPIAATVFENSATEDVEVLRAKVANHRRMMNNSPEPIKSFYRNELTKLNARLRAAEHAQIEEREDRQSVKEWSILGKTVTVTGVFVGAAVIATLMSVSGYFNRRERKGHG